jgi:2-hydroxychromene-2-carboxylate isomerase
MPMSKTLDFYFDFVSPASYLAFTQLPALAARYNAQIQWRPVLLGGIFRSVNNQSPLNVAPKGRYFMEDMMRFASRYGVEMRFPANFPMNSLSLMRSASAMQMHEPARLADYIGLIFRSIWVDRLDMADPAVFATTIAAHDFNAEQIGTWISDPAVKQKLLDDTNAAVERGLFGVPTMFVGGKMFFGQDRLDFVEEALAA